MHLCSIFCPSTVDSLIPEHVNSPDVSAAGNQIPAEGCVAHERGKVKRGVAMRGGCIYEGSTAQQALDHSIVSADGSHMKRVRIHLLHRRTAC